MNNVKKLEHAICNLTREELSEFRSWFQAFDAAAWDRQFEEDVSAGRLEHLAEEALTELKTGQTRPL